MGFPPSTGHPPNGLTVPGEGHRRPAQTSRWGRAVRPLERCDRLRRWLGPVPPRRRAVPCPPLRRRVEMATIVPVTDGVVRGACPHDCPDTCAMLVTVESGRAVRVQGDPEHPFTNGFLCTKVNRYIERTYHRD